MLKCLVGLLAQKEDEKIGTSPKQEGRCTKARSKGPPRHMSNQHTRIQAIDPLQPGSGH